MAMYSVTTLDQVLTADGDAAAIPAINAYLALMALAGLNCLTQGAAHQKPFASEDGSSAERLHAIYTEVKHTSTIGLRRGAR